MESLAHLDRVEVKVAALVSELGDLKATFHKWFKDHNDKLEMHEQDITSLKIDLLGLIDGVDEKCRTVSNNLLVQQESSRKDAKSIAELYDGVAHDLVKQAEMVTKAGRDTHALQVRMQSVKEAIDQLGAQQCPFAPLYDQLLRRLDEVIEEQRVLRELVQLQRGSPSYNKSEGQLLTLDDEIGPFSTPTRLPSGLCFLTPGLIALADGYDSEAPSNSAGSGIELPLAKETSLFGPVETPRAVHRNLARDFSMQFHSLADKGEESSAQSPVTRPIQLFYAGQDVEDDMADDPPERHLSTTTCSQSDSSPCDLHFPTCTPSFEGRTIESKAELMRSREREVPSSPSFFKLLKLDEGFDLQFKPLPPLPDDKPDLLGLFDFNTPDTTTRPLFFNLSPLCSKIHDYVEQLRFSIVQHNRLRTIHTYWLRLTVFCFVVMVALVSHKLHRKGMNVGVNQRADPHFWSPGEGYSIQLLEGL